GIVFLASPLFLYWFIHGDYDRYLWIINGPYPFSHFGSAPFQAAMGLGLILAGVVLIIASVLLQKKIKENND
nr:hypothetical protein [Candidatus Saccharibacteria bacterium]NIV03772.1 hypothetical protein [Calditrichia bacterium]NIV72064.1 hypothetical protein [Calditrichia bacterium]